MALNEQMRDPGDEDDGDQVIDRETGETKAARNARLLAAKKPPCALVDYVSREVEHVYNPAQDRDEAES